MVTKQHHKRGISLIIGSLQIADKSGTYRVRGLGHQEGKLKRTENQPMKTNQCTKRKSEVQHENTRQHDYITNGTERERERARAGEREREADRERD